MTATCPTVRLNTGAAMPLIGLGVLLVPQDEGGAVVSTAIEAGYRLIDTAAAYNNERAVGEGIRHSGIDRSELFVTTKLWMSDYGNRAERGLETSLKKLGLDYVDLYLLHWPMPGDFRATIEAYKTVASLVADGRVRAVGVCNFGEGHLETLLSETETVPAINQVELNPYFSQRSLREAHRHHGIVTEAWAPIGGDYGRKPDLIPGDANTPLKHAVVTSLGEKYGKTPAQILLRWHIQHGIVAIPKSSRSERIVQNFDVFDFELSAGEMETLDGIDTGVRAGLNPNVVKVTTFPIKVGEA